MTEAQWRACDNPEELRKFLGERLSARRWRLFACAVCRDPDLWERMPEKERSAVAAAERRAERSASVDELKAARNLARRDSGPFFSWCAYWAAAPGASRKDMAGAVRYVILHALIVRWKFAGLQARICGLLRDVAGNPIRPVKVVPAWLKANAGAVPAIARAIYEERAFDRLPILGDALEDAGCHNSDLLAHCRGPGPHVLGCWAVDLLLGKS
jgi:hypothetical protein